jgi:hypothetical protein
MALRARPGRWLAVLLAACFALPGAASGASRIPESDAAALARQRAVARSLKLDAIWAGARSERHEARERAELLRRARHGERAAKRGLRVRRAEGDGSPLVADPPSAPFAPARAAAAASTAAAPTNTRCNDPSGDIAAAAQSETAVAAIGPHVVTAWNDGQGFSVTNGDVIGFGWSADGGATFTDGGAPPHPAAWPGFYWTSDPVLTANEKTGDFYLCGLADPDPTHNAIAVAHGRFSGAAFAFDSVWIVRSVPSSSVVVDKPWVACDSSTGRVFVVHTAFGALDSIDFQASGDGGRTWSAPLTLSSSTDAGYVQGPRVAVGPNGEVATAWYAVDAVTDADDLRFRRSLDHGVSFTPELTMKFNSQFGTGSPGFNRERGVNFPSLAVDRSSGPHRGRTYLAWAESWDFLATVLPPAGSTSRSEVEPDDAAASATPFTPGQTLRGVLAPAGAADQDWFSCTLSAGQNLVVYADSVTLAPWYVRLIAPDGAQRLCFAGNPSGSSSNAAYFGFTAPVTGTYYLRMLEVNAVTIAYRIRTALGTRGSERGRDQRDAFVAWTDDGASWSTPARVNDDAAGYDDWLPEVAAGGDGCVYATWYDHRDDSYGSRTKIYAARSSDGGATWAAAQTVASAQGNFTTAGTNIAPNTGDYMALASSGDALLPVWGDARNVSSVDAWSAAIATGAAIASTPNDTTMGAPGTATFGWTLTSANPLFAGSYGVTVTSQRAWPMPAPANVTLGTGSGTYPNGAPNAMSFAADVSVPDSAASGPNRVTLTLTSPGGVVLARSSFTITVAASALDVSHAGAEFALSPPSPNPAFASVRLGYVLPRAGHARLVLYDLAGAKVRTLLDGAAAAGPASTTWDGRDDRGNAMRTGEYFVRLESDGAALSRRLVWMR